MIPMFIAFNPCIGKCLFTVILPKFKVAETINRLRF